MTNRFRAFLASLVALVAVMVPLALDGASTGSALANAAEPSISTQEREPEASRLVAGLESVGEDDDDGTSQEAALPLPSEETGPGPSSGGDRACEGLAAAFGVPSHLFRPPRAS